ncbi:MAG: hypothetical protein ACLF0G_10270 [Candidatus Brocadiia bacterium]
MPPRELQRKLRSLRGHLRRLIVLAGVSRVVLVLAAALAVALLVDWAAKLHTPGRAILLGATCAAVGYALWRYLIAPLRVRLDDEALALLIERRFPELRDRLISTVQFGRRGEMAPLSQAMVDQLTSDTLRETQPLDFQAVSAPRRPALWAAAAGAAVVAACGFILLFPTTAGIFGCRFLNPFSSVEWPRRTQLSVLAYDRDKHQLPIERGRISVPKGEDLHLLVRAARHSGRLWEPPERVTVHYRFEAGGQGRRNVPMGERATYRTAFPTVTDAFSFHVTGDDDDTDTFTVQVRNRPRIRDIRVSLEAPPFVGPNRTRLLPQGRGNIAGLASSVARVELATNKPIATEPGSAQIVVDGQPPIPMSFVDGDERRLRGSFVLREGQKHYAIELVDTEGLGNSPPAVYRLDVRTDRAPDVKLPEPGRNKKITPKAVVPIRVVAEDDYGMTRLRFVFRRDEKGDPVVHTFPEPTAEEANEVARAHPWDITSLALEVGQSLRVHAEAEDGHQEQQADGTWALQPNVGRSAAYTLTVISEAEMASLLQRRQQQLKEQLKNLIERQESSKDDVQQLAAPRDEPVERHRISLAEREQRKIGVATDNIAEQLEGVLRDMKNNKVGDLAEQRRAEELATTLRSMAETRMPEAADRIAQAAHTAEPAHQRGQLADAAQKQRRILDELRAALRRFDQWYDIDELLRDASELLLAQRKLNQRTADLARELLGKPAEKLTPAETGTARSLARDQRGARDRMQALETKMAAVARKLAATEPAAAKIVDQALSQATADQIRRRMDDAAGEIQQARPASAPPHQKQATGGLERLVEALTKARSPYLARDLQRLQEQLRKHVEKLDRLLAQERRQLTETAIANLRRHLQKLRKLQQAARQATHEAPSQQALRDQAADQQGHARQASSLAQKTGQLAHSASQQDRKSLAQAADAIQNASQQMSKAQESLDQGDKPHATGAQDQALQKLDEADRHLQRLQERLARREDERQRLAQQAAEQQQTANQTSQAAQDIQDTARSARRILPDTADTVQQAGQSTSQAAQAMSQAQQQLSQAAQQPNAGPAQQQQAQQDQQDAVERLEEARDRLAQAHDQLDLRRRQRELFELEKALTAMLPRQVAVREGTQTIYAETKAATKDLTHAQGLALRELADKQHTLHDEAGDICKRLEQNNVPVFLYVMRDTARTMSDVHQRLAEHSIDWDTQERQRDIERNIAQLIDALKEEAQRLAEQQRRGGGGGGQGPPRPQPLVPPLAQLKQLRTLQLMINEKARELELKKERLVGRRQRLLENQAQSLGRKQAELGKLANDFADELESETQESVGPP